ncbi:MAG: monovalent cation/H+ antiporter subunit D family protein [Gammaproteobacteria bacterium]|nr:MAG: monovalent cation/H+ antiporter subunit D family protein [Gammaproteobacteria bacterium]
MSDSMLIALPLAVPLIGLLLIVASGRVDWLRDGFTVATAVAMFTAVLQLLPKVSAGERPRLELFELLPGLGITFEIEPLGMVFAMLASGLWILTALYAIGYMRGAKEKHHTRFHAFFAVALFSATGIAFAGNMFTLFVFYEVLTLSTYPLVAHKGTDAARAGARTYLGLLLGTSVAFLLLATLLTWWLAGTLDFTPGGIMTGRVDPVHGSILLLLFMYGIGKAALMPFHRWLPAAMVAPTPVSALLHAVAVVKAGVFTVLKVTVYLFGLDYLAELATSEVVLYIAVFTLLAASLVALRQDNLKARLAYSTVSQLSYIVVGAMLVNQIAALGGSLHIVMHAFGKITLFFCAGAIYVATKKTEISDMDGLGRRMPITFAAFFLGALCVIGIPPMGGVWSKWHLMMGAFDAGYGLVVSALMISTLLNIGYLIPPVVRAFLLPPKDGGGGVREAPFLCVLPLSLTALGCLALFFLAENLAAVLSGMFSATPAL